MPDTEHINVPDSLGGDYCVRYRGPDRPAHSIVTGDVLVLDSTSSEFAERLVVTTDSEGQAWIIEFEDGLSVLGVVVGVMRRIDA